MTHDRRRARRGGAAAVRGDRARSDCAGTDGGNSGSGSCCDGEVDAAKFGEALYDAEQRGELRRRRRSPRSATTTRPR